MAGASVGGAVVVASSAIALSGPTVFAPATATRPVSSWELLAVALLALAVVMLWRWPLAALALLLGESLVFAIGQSTGGIALALLVAAAVALCWIAASAERRRSIIAFAATIAVVAAYVLGRAVLPYDHIAPAASVGLLLSAVIAWLIGEVIGRRRVYREALRVETTQRAVTEERLRIARELHDMVAHNVGIIAIQAAAGERLFESRPAEAHRALGTIEQTSRDTLAGLRRLLVALREGDVDRSETAPTPRLADLETLVAGAAKAGVRVELIRRGVVRSLPSEIELSAYRIVQEAITNVIRHADTASCQVTIEYEDAEVHIEVTDEGRGTAESFQAGYGLVGMRERVQLLHGTFQARPRPEGGFRVSASLPG